MTDSVSHNALDSHSSLGLGASSISGSRPSGPASYLQLFPACKAIPERTDHQSPQGLTSNSPFPDKVTTLVPWWTTKTLMGYQSPMNWLWHSLPLMHKDTELGFERLVISIITLFWLLRLTTWAMPKYIIINWWARVLKIWLYDMCLAISPSVLLLGNY